MTLLYWARYGLLAAFAAVAAYMVYAHVSTLRRARRR